MRAIVGVQTITSGKVTVLGHPAGSAPLRRVVGYSTQSPAVYQDLTVTENLRYFAAVRGDDPKDVQRVLELVGLTHYAHRLAGRLEVDTGDAAALLRSARKLRPAGLDASHQLPV